MVWIPFAAAQGQPAVLADNGAGLELASLRQSPVLIRCRLRSSAQPDGWGKKANAGTKIRSAGSAQRFLHGNPKRPSCVHAGAAHATT